ncbi:hypothetical protein BGW42_006194 [Actinomortierella wolfii]|nr:hypothetical protein BGW42_006194 [Actinomortierella wolfii]KAG0234903.1 hypothetical protein BGW41_000973 [Actinomortierella wolfii]
MATLQSSNAVPHQVFPEKKPPLLPRQSTSDVLSFTHIIANRLAPGQTVWEFFSPPSVSSPTTATSTSAAATNTGSTISNTTAVSNCASPPVSPTFSKYSPPSPTETPVSTASAASPATATTPTTTATTTTSNKANNRRSLLFFGSLTKSSPALDIQETAQRNDSSSSTNNSNNHTNNGPLSPVSPTGPSPVPAGTTENNVSHYAQSAGSEPTPKAQKRKSFAQSLRNMLSLSSLLSSSKAASPPPSATPPHYNILVLGSDSAPLASTLYKMSGVLPGASKIGHYQEISGFFVAYFKSDGSFSCSPPLQGTVESERHPATATSSSPVTRSGPDVGTKTACEVDSKMVEEVAALVVKRASDVQSDEIKSRRRSSGEYVSTAEACMSQSGDENSLPRSSVESMSTLIIAPASSLPTSSAFSSRDDLSLKTTTTTSTITGGPSHSADVSPSDAIDSLHRIEALVDGEEYGPATTATLTTSKLPSPQHKTSETTLATTTPSIGADHVPAVSPSANASLSIHAFSLDTTWPVPRILAQTFWFPHAHGIIYVVDATRKHDPRGMDHLLNARQFLASLVSDPFFKRADIPIVVFANKAGLDETCFRVDEIADILGCEEWDEANPCPHGLNGDDSGTDADGVQPSSSPTVPSSSSSASTSSSPPPRPWCVKSTRADGSGDGLRESVEWLKSRMGEVWKS